MAKVFVGSIIGGVPYVLVETRHTENDVVFITTDLARDRNYIPARVNSVREAMDDLREKLTDGEGSINWLGLELIDNAYALSTSDVAEFMRDR